MPQPGLQIVVNAVDSFPMRQFIAARSQRNFLPPPERRNFGVALKHLKARIDQVYTVEDRLQLG